MQGPQGFWQVFQLVIPNNGAGFESLDQPDQEKIARFTQGFDKLRVIDLVYSGLDNGVPFSETGAGVITVRKGPGDNKLLFNHFQEHPACLNVMTFEMPEFIFVQDCDRWVLSGSGFFKDGGQVEYTLRGKLDDRNTQLTNVAERKQ